MKKVELLAPVGNREKLDFAILYGADSVYVGVNGYSLRAGAGNFTLEELGEVGEVAHQAGVKVYAAVNIFARNQDFQQLPKVIAAVKKGKIDALIVGDPGVFYQVRQLAPELNVHLSTQANITNLASARFWQQQGAKRVTLARELSLDEVSAISGGTDIEAEIFVHGAMCISYSGRCFLSKYLAGRDANQGDCAHSCRWKYFLLEEKRPGVYHPVYEDERGFYIFNSKDLRLAPLIPKLIKAGVSSFKIEGRMKSIHYLATVVKVYRTIIDNYYEKGDKFKFKEEWLAELEKVSHRRYTLGFLNGDQERESAEDSAYIRRYDFAGIVKGKARNKIVVDVRNRLAIGDKLEILTPTGSVIALSLKKMMHGDAAIDSAHANSRIEIPVNEEIIPAGSIIRRANAFAPVKDKS